MFTRLRARLTDANVVATLRCSSARRLFLRRQQDKRQPDPKRVDRWQEVKRNTLGGARIKESRLGTVPRARNAGGVGGLSAQQLLLRSRRERSPPPTSASKRSRERRTPTTAPSFIAGGLTARPGPGGDCLPTANCGGRSTSTRWVHRARRRTHLEVHPSGSSPRFVDALYMTDQLGSVGVVADGPGGEKAFRCVADPLN